MTTEPPPQVAPDKKCAKCNAEPVTISVETTFVRYFNCATCLHVWSEPRPPGSLPIKAIWQKKEPL